MCVDFVVTNHSRVCQGRHHSSAVIEPRDPISCENCFLSYRDFCGMYSGKIVFCIQAKVTYCWHSLSGMG